MASAEKANDSNVTSIEEARPKSKKKFLLIALAAVLLLGGGGAAWVAGGATARPAANGTTGAGTGAGG